MSRPGTRRVPSGSFRRGSDRSADEGPVATVHLSAFDIDVVPVTNRDFATFVAANGYRNRKLWSAAGWEWVSRHGVLRPAYERDPVWGEFDMPVTGISWWEAAAYARFRGGQLPSEAQWERACGGPDGRSYPWGEDPPISEFANFAPDGEPLDRRPTLATAHERNCSGFGIIDLAGNFAEWCLDNYRSRYGPEVADPVCLIDEGDDHVVRGGSGLHDGEYLRCTARDSYSPTIRDNLISFRCVYRPDD